MQVGGPAHGQLCLIAPPGQQSRENIKLLSLKQEKSNGYEKNYDVFDYLPLPMLGDVIVCAGITITSGRKNFVKV